MSRAIRFIAGALGAVLDEEDRRVVGAGLVLALALATAVVALAAGAGLAIRVFEFTNGG